MSSKDNFSHIIFFSLSDNTFASGSIDGTIILWKTDNLLPFRYFNSITDYQGPSKIFPYSVQHMICIESVSMKIKM